MTEEQFKWFTSDHGKRKAMFTKEELRQKIKDNPEEWKCDGNPTFERIGYIWPHLKAQ